MEGGYYCIRGWFRAEETDEDANWVLGYLERRGTGGAGGGWDLLLSFCCLMSCDIAG